jgi:NTE family protein
LFPPVIINSVPYVDGGLSNNLPVEPFNDRRDEVICVHVNPIKLFNPKESVLEVMDRAWHLSFRNMVNRSSDGCYLSIEPTELDIYGLFDFHKSAEIFDVGYMFTKELLQNNPHISK